MTQNHDDSTTSPAPGSSACRSAILALGSAGAIDPATRAHLATCADCSAWAQDEGQLLRAWAATRPAEPSAETWNALWNQISARLDHAGSTTRPSVIAMPERSVAPLALGRVRPALIVLALAQAAAIVAAVWLAPGRVAVRPVGPTETLAQATIPADFEIDAGQVVILREKAGTWDKDVLASDDSSSQVDSNYAMFNVVEAMDAEIE